MPSGIYIRTEKSKGHIPWNKGKVLSEETKRKMSESHKGKPPGNKGFLIKKFCKICKKPFEVHPCFNKAKCCSTKCAGIFRRGKQLSKETKRKMSEAQKGEKHHAWKGGKFKDGEGYILILSPTHPFSAKSGYIRQHRLVMEKHLNRYLKPEEVVHHINEIRTDNRLENLKLFKNMSEHMAHHRSLIKLKKVTE